MLVYRKYMDIIYGYNSGFLLFIMCSKLNSASWTPIYLFRYSSAALFAMLSLYSLYKWICTISGGCCWTVAKLCPTLCNPMEWSSQSSQSFTISWSLLKLMSPVLVMLSNHLILCCSLLFWPSIFPSIRVLSSEVAVHIRWPKYWSFSFSIRLSNEYSELISFRTDWLDLLAIQGTLKSLLQHHNLKASVIWCSAFCKVQLSHSYMITGKTIALTITDLRCCSRQSDVSAFSYAL